MLRSPSSVVVASVDQLWQTSAAQAKEKSSMWVLSIFLGCPAAMLGIELPPEGAKAISMEDLKRDCFALRKEDPEKFFAKRMEQMRVADLNTGDGWICATIGDAPADRLQSGWVEDTDTAASAAALISIAKAWDGQSPNPGLELCMARRDPPTPMRTTRLGPLAPGALDPGPPLHSGQPDPQRALEDLDYDELRQKTVAIWTMVQPGSPL
jgi:hypothetical protein